MNNISDSSKLILNQELLQSEIDGETIMMSIDNGKYYGLNTVASRIWEIVKSEPVFIDLINTLTSEYEIGEEKCKTETLNFLEKLIENNLIKIE